MWWRGADAPFDRHDWIVDRCGRQVRYVIDYYEGQPEPDGTPTMNVHVRPALDSVESFVDRLRNFFK
jgi:cytochrome c heme-lyase